MPEFLVMVEHLEPCLNKWIVAEYTFVSKIYGSRTVFTNVKNERHRRILSQYAKVYETSAIDILSDVDNVIVLDPKANKRLEPEELVDVKYVVLGGIMGDHPPRGRTSLYITYRLPRSRARNIGDKQYTIAGATYVLKQIELGKRVDDIKFVYGLSIRRVLHDSIEIEIHLPYAFPLDDYGNIVLPSEYLEIVADHVIVHENRTLTRAEDDVC